MEQLTAPLQKRTVAFQKYLLGRRRIVETVLSKINLPNCPRDIGGLISFPLPSYRA